MGNDTGGVLVQLLIAQGAERVGAVVPASCDAYDDFPPALTGRAVVLAGGLPTRAVRPVHAADAGHALRRLPIAFGRLTKRGDAVTARWMRPILAVVADSCALIALDRPGALAEAIRGTASPS
ncbi:hypothetical protein OG900_02550 [Streptomyces sp. NBC_00433]